MNMPKVRSLGVRMVALLLVSMLSIGCTQQMRKLRHQRRAENFLKAGDLEKAKIEFFNVLRIDPQDAATFKALGSMFLDQGSPLRAGPFLARARELNPKDMEARVKITQVFLAVGATEDARKEILNILEQQPNNGLALVLLSDACRRPEDVPILQTAVEKFPDKNNALYQVGLASLGLRKGDFTGAEAALKKAAEIDPKLPTVHTALAALHLFQNDAMKAGEELKIAADLSPIRSGERVKYAEFKAATGDPDAATAYLREMTAKEPEFVPAWSLLAQIAFTLHKNDEALSFLEHALKLDPDNPDARMLEAQIRMARGEAAKAVQNLDRLNKIYPNVPLIKLQLARANVVNNDFPAAAAVLNELVATTPDFVDAQLLLADVNLHNGDNQAVVNAMQELLKKQPDLPRAQLLLVDAYRGLGNFEQASEIFREQVKKAPLAPQGYLGLGIVLRQQNKLEEAQAALEKALELGPQLGLAAEQLVDVQLAREDLAGALQTVQRQLEKTPNSAPMYVARGKIFAAQKQFDEAAAAFNKAIELDPNLNAAYDLLIATYMATNKVPEAAAQLETAVTKASNKVPLLLVLGMTYEKMKEYTKARDAYEKLLAIKPDTAPALNNLAYLYSERLNQPQQAVETARRARALQPGDGSVADTLGWALYRQGDYQQAIGLLQEAATKLPDLPDVQYHLGMAAYMMGEKELARTALGKAVAAKTDFDGKEEAQRRLSNIEQGGALPEMVSSEQLEAALKQQPNDLVTANRLAEAYERKGENAKAAAAYEQVLKINPKLVAAAVKLVELYGGPLHDKDKALAWAKKAREMAPRDLQVASVLGRIAYQMGNFTWAHSLLQESVRQSPEDAALQHQFAWAAYGLGKLKDAQEAMTKVIELAPETPMAEDAKSFLALTDATGSSAPDGEVVRKRLQTDPEDGPALMAQAAGQRKSGDSKAAAETYNRVLTRFPDFGPAQKELASIYVNDPANLTKAYDLATKARRTLSDDPEINRILGVVSFQRKEFSQAIQLLQQSARKQPLDPESLYFLGMAQVSTKRPEGVETLKQALAGGLKDPMAGQARHAVEEKEKPAK